MPVQHAMLLVDASAETAALVAETVGSNQWTIQTAASNEAALAAVQGTYFDLVVTSEKTCAQEDVDLLRKIRRVRPHTRVIILTDAGAPAGLIAAMRENAFSFMKAPFAPEQFKEALRIAIESPPWDDGIELQSATSSWIRLYARCDHSTADRIVLFINEIAGDLAPKDRRDLSTAFREMLLNAMEHGGHFDPKEYVEISYLRSSRAISCRIRDPGKGFSLEEIPHSAMANPPESPCAHIEHREAQGMRPGGFGILLTKNLVDELVYNEQGNEVLLIKYLDNATREKAAHLTE